MTPSPIPVFQASDLARKRRVFIDAARSGLARLRDTDGTSLVMIPEARLAALMEIVDWAHEHLVLDATMRKPGPARSAKDFGAAAWLRYLDEDDLATFVSELGEELLVAAATESADGLRQLVDDWRVTAEAVSDPERRAVLTGRHQIDDFVEVDRPK